MSSARTVGRTAPRSAGRPLLRAGILALLTALTVGTACSRQRPVELMLYCGAGIRPAAEALIDAFRREHGISFQVTYAGSGRLLGQISSLQKGDLFMPGAELYVDTAIEKGLADAGSKRIVAHFVPVVLVRKGNPLGIRSVEDFISEQESPVTGEIAVVAVLPKAVFG